MENIIYTDYKGRVQIDVDTLIVSAWNKYVDVNVNGEGDENENKIFVNDKEFFKNSFKNAYDAACAVSLSDAWLWCDRFVYFSDDGLLVSFTHWAEKNSPIDLDKIDIHNLINGLK